MIENTYTTFKTKEGKKIDISEYETIGDVVEALFEYTPYRGYEYFENFLEGVPLDSNGKINIEELSECEISKLFGTIDMVEKFENSDNAVVLVGNCEVLFLLDDKKNEEELLMEWLLKQGTLIE